ncbi:formimidoyltetrahydrofolate cyclodeaminase [uncultured archaeon]|nr:formimidoyltetrahydrofolate cyclodeaminase [uncultured archaeon]
MESYDTFLERLASSSPAPGGGAASAMVSIVASSLNQMVASLTVNKRKYEEYEGEMNSIIEKSKKIDADLRKFMKDDEDAFNEIIKALKMPKNSDEEVKERKDKIVEASKGAIRVPWKIASASREVLELALALARHGNRNAVTDAGCAALFAHSAIEGVLYNVKINLNSVKDEEFAREEKSKMSIFMKDCDGLKSEVLQLVEAAIGDE